MKEFKNFDLDINKLQTELDEFKQLLDSKNELSEAVDILPFFKEKKHLSSYIGSFNINITTHDRIAHEFDIWGDFKTDLAVGDSSSKAFCFVEFENAKKDSIFKKVGSKTTTEWASRFEHGLSQVIDWFYKLEDQRPTRDFRSKFGGEDITYIGLLVIGRTADISDKDKSRLSWRSDKMIVNSIPILCLTFDELYERLYNKIILFSAASQVDDD